MRVARQTSGETGNWGIADRFPVDGFVSYLCLMNSPLLRISHSCTFISALGIMIGVDVESTVPYACSISEEGWHGR